MVYIQYIYNQGTVHMIRALYLVEMGFSVFSYRNLLTLLLILCCPLFFSVTLCWTWCFLCGWYLGFSPILIVITTNTGVAEQETPESADWSGLAGTLKWLAETKLRPKNLLNNSPCTQVLPLQAELLMNCKLQTRLPAAYHLLRVLRIKKGCKELLKNTGRGRKSVPLKQIKGKERSVVSEVTLKGFDEQQLPKDGINYLLQAWANWLLCKHQCTDSFSDIILIHIRTVIYSFSPSQPHSSSPLLLSRAQTFIYTLFFWLLCDISLFSDPPLPLPLNTLTPFNHLHPVLLFWSCCPWNASSITDKITAIQGILPALRVFKTSSPQGNLPFVKKGEGSRWNFRVVLYRT